MLEPIHISLSNIDKQIFTNYFKIADNLIHTEGKKSKALNYLILSMYVRLHTIYDDTKNINNGTRKSRIEEICNMFIRYINMDDVFERNVTWYAEKMNISTGYLRRAVWKQKGQAPKDLIDEAIVQKAKAILLEDRTVKINSIAEQLNFSDAPQFVRFFKKYVGITPAEFRKRMI